MVIFDKSGRGLSGWHYRQLKEIGGERVQQSVVEFRKLRLALEFATKLKEFGVRELRVYRARELVEWTTKVRSQTPLKQHCSRHHRSQTVASVHR